MSEDCDFFSFYEGKKQQKAHGINSYRWAKEDEIKLIYIYILFDTFSSALHFIFGNSAYAYL